MFCIEATGNSLEASAMGVPRTISIISRKKMELYDDDHSESDTIFFSEGFPFKSLAEGFEIVVVTDAVVGSGSPSLSARHSKALRSGESYHDEY